jgi:hypothetical protein
VSDVSSDVKLALEAVRDPDGLLRHERMVEAARDPSSPLHQHYTWDAQEALDKCHIAESRALIRRLRIPYVITPVISIRAPAYLPEPTESMAWRRISDVEPGSDMARKMVLKELAYVGGVIGRARNIAIALGLRHEIDDLMSAIANFERRLEDA